MRSSVKKSLSLTLALLMLAALASCDFRISKKDETQAAPETAAAPADVTTAVPEDPSSPVSGETSSPATTGEGTVEAPDVTDPGATVVPQLTGIPEVTQPGDVVTVIIPKEMADGMSSFEAAEEAKNQGFLSGTVNADHDAVFIMERPKYEELVGELKRSVEEDISEMTSGGFYSCTGVKYDTEGFTYIDIYSPSEEASFADGLVAGAFVQTFAQIQVVLGRKFSDIDVIARVVSPTSKELLTLTFADFWAEYAASNPPAPYCEHDYVLDETVEPSYGHGGYTEYICKKCGKIYRTGELPALEYPSLNVTLWDAPEGSFRVTGVYYDDIWGFTVEYEIENRSTKKLTFSFSDTAVNGFMIDPYLYKTVDPGAKIEDTADFSASAFELCGIDAVRRIDLTFTVSDAEDFFADPVYEEQKVLWPLGDTEATYSPAAPADREGQVTVVNEEGYTFILRDIAHSDDGDIVLEFFIRNGSEKELSFGFAGVTVDGKPVEPYFSRSVMPGGMLLSGTTLYKSTLDSAGITTSGQMTFTLRVSEAGSWNGPLLEKTVTVDIG